MARAAITGLALGAACVASTLAGEVTDKAARKAAALGKLAQQNVAASPASLRKAATDGDAVLVRTLLDAGLDPNAYSSVVPRSVLGLVVSGCGEKSANPPANRDAVVAVLLEGGANPNFMELGRLPLLAAAAEACPRPVIEALVKAGAKLDLASPRGLTALPVALTRNNLDAAEALVDLGARLTPGQRAALFPEAPTDPRMLSSAPAEKSK